MAVSKAYARLQQSLNASYLFNCKMLQLCNVTLLSTGYGQQCPPLAATLHSASSDAILLFCLANVITRPYLLFLVVVFYAKKTSYLLDCAADLIRYMDKSSSTSGGSSAGSQTAAGGIVGSTTAPAAYGIQFMPQPQSTPAPIPPLSHGTLHWSGLPVPHQLSRIAWVQCFRGVWNRPCPDSIAERCCLGLCCHHTELVVHCVCMLDFRSSCVAGHRCYSQAARLSVLCPAAEQLLGLLQGCPKTLLIQLHLCTQAPVLCMLKHCCESASSTLASPFVAVIDCLWYAECTS